MGGAVNVNISPEAASATTTNNHISNNVIIKTKDDIGKDLEVSYPPQNEQNPYSDVVDRDIESAKETLRAFNALGINDSSYAEALTLIIDIIQSNPLIQNKYIISHVDELTKLITLLTEADDVKIEINEDVGCCGIKSIAEIETIHIKKGDDICEFKYSYPLVKSLFIRLHISTKYVSMI